jgi:ABC-type xylose transport system permease subunit
VSALAQFFYEPDCFGNFIFAAGGNDDSGTFAGVGQRNGAPDTASAASNHSDLFT